MTGEPALNRFYVSLDGDLEAMARKLPAMLREMEPGDALAFRRLREGGGPDFEVVVTRPGLANGRLGVGER